MTIEQDALVDALNAVGEQVRLRRLGTPAIDVVCQARIMDYTQQEISGSGVLQGDRRMIMSNAEIAAAGWPGPPRRGDQVTYQNRSASVQGCDTLVIGGEIVRHNVQLRSA